MGTECLTSHPLGIEIALPGPVGEHNLYALHPRGPILLLPCTRTGLIEQVMAALADGNDMVIRDDILFRESLGTLPPMVAARLRWTTDWETQGPYAAALIEDAGEARLKALAAIARLPGPIVLAQTDNYRSEWLVEEVSTSINTTAAGGNATLMALA